MTELPSTEKVYTARGAAAQLFDCHAPEILFEGPAGTGKTRAILEKINWLCETYAGIRVLVVRATRTRLTQSVLVTLEEDVLWPGHPAISGEAGRENRSSYDYPNGSTIVCGGLDDGDRWFSTQWDVIYLAEATEATSDQWEKFGRAMRNRGIPRGVSGGPIQLSDDGTPAEAQAIEIVDGEKRPAYWRQRIADCNPGPPGHWLNQRAKAGKMVRLKGRHRDNPSIDQGYLDVLRNMTGYLRARLYEGRWVAAEGSVYPQFDVDRHVVTPFDIPDDWPIFLGWDPGFDHPTAILWIAVAPNGCLYVFDEIYRGGRSVAEHCANVHDRNATGCIGGGRTIRGYYGDPQHCFSKTAQAVQTIADQARKCGITLAPWPRTGNDALAMVNAVRELLNQDRVKVFATCTNTVSEFQTWQHKRTASGELPPGDDQFEDRDNHAMDVIKGLVAAKIGRKREKTAIGGR